GPFHLLRESNPARSGAAANSLSRGRGFDLSAVSIPALLPGARVAHGGGRRRLRSGFAARALRDSAFYRGVAGAADARNAAARAVRDDASWDGYHAGGRGPVVFSDHAIFDREVERDYQHQRGLEAAHL